jgi:hypothetical protein
MCEKYFDKIKYFLKFETLNAYFRYFLIFTAKKTILKRPLTLFTIIHLLIKTIYYEKKYLFNALVFFNHYQPFGASW